MPPVTSFRCASPVRVKTIPIYGFTSSGINIATGSGFPVNSVTGCGSMVKIVIGSGLIVNSLIGFEGLLVLVALHAARHVVQVVLGL